MIIFRNDDVNANSNIADIIKIYGIIKKYVPKCKIYSAVTVLAKRNDQGKPYPDGYDDIFDTDLIFDYEKYWPYLENIISHGLFHAQHGRMTNQGQKMSILASCRILGTDKFLPPFNEWNGFTVTLCKKHGITIIGDSEYNNKVRKYLKKEALPGKGVEWKSFETEKFDPNYEFWLFHSWRFTPESFEEKIRSDLLDNSVN